MFNEKSNTTFNTECLKQIKVAAMHETMIRLYEVAKKLDIHSQTELAKAMNESPQTINNWESRGISTAGMVKAAIAFKCSAAWLSTGEGKVWIEDVLDKKIEDKHSELNPKQQALLGYFNGLTESQQEEVMRELQEKKQQNDNLLLELLERRSKQK